MTKEKISEFENSVIENTMTNESPVLYEEL